MKKYALLLLFICVAKITFATTIPETLIFRDSVLLFAVHNNQVITISQDKERNFLLSVNGQIDTIQVINPPETYWRNVRAYRSNRNSIYFTNVFRGINLYRLDLDTREVSVVSTLGRYDFLIDEFLVRGCGHECASLIFDDLNNLNASDTIGLTELFFTSYLISANKILIEFYESGSLDGFGYYDWENRKLVDHLPVLDTMRFEPILDEEGRVFRISSIHDITYIFTDVTGNYSNLNMVWVDRYFNIIQPTLQSNRSSFATSSLGIYNPFFYRASFIEGRRGNREVWVACRFTLSFDKALYNIFHNVLLERAVVETFDAWELRKLRNMVFAKHGFQFESEYLQAFFNLFDFYNHIVKTRNVNHLLTPVDRQNLALIQEVSRQRERATE